MKKRADILLVEKGFFDSRNRAQEAIRHGGIAADGSVIHKASQEISDTAYIEILSLPHNYVSRGGLKLEAALRHFLYNVKNKVCLDMGASTGGFSQVLLQEGVKRIYSVDVGHGQLHPSLREDPRIVNLERTDIRHLNKEIIPEPVEVVVSDVSFISLKLILPQALSLISDNAVIIVLIKPQFEAGKEAVKKGIVKDPTIHDRVCQDICNFITGFGFQIHSIIPSPILGGDGNKEYLLGAIKS